MRSPDAGRSTPEEYTGAVSFGSSQDIGLGTERFSWKKNLLAIPLYLACFGGGIFVGGMVGTAIGYIIDAPQVVRLFTDLGVVTGIIAGGMGAAIIGLKINNID